jgi:hypothetical protein
MPVTEDQANALREVWDAHLVRWEGAQTRPGKPRWTLVDFVEVTKSRLEAEERIDRILTAAQRDALRPADVRGRLGFDPFSPITVWRDRVVIVPAPDDATLAVRLATTWMAESHAGGPKIAEVAKQQFAEWAKARPAAWRRGARGPLSRAGWVTETELLPGVLALPEATTAIARALGADDRPEAPFHKFRKALVPARLDE